MMNHPGAINLQLFASIGAAFMALMVIIVRIRASRKPTSVMKIVMPTVGMSTGFFMFFYEPMRIPFSWALTAFLVGAVLFSYPLIRTSKFHVVAGKIYVKRSKSFVFILLGLLILRILLHDIIEQYISLEQTGALFFVLAFGMLLPWRIAMLVNYIKLYKTEAWVPVTKTK
ncbi:MAG TPA: cytochrome c biogenesis protein CcdC [Bacilli bacterium]